MEIYRYKDIKDPEIDRQLAPMTTNNSSFQIHPQAVYTSRLLDFKNLPEPQNSKEINEKFYSNSLVFDFGQMNLNDNREENYQNIHPSFTPELIQS